MNQDIHGGNVWKAAYESDTAPDKILDFSASINPFIKHEKFINRVCRSLRYISIYPDPDYTDLTGVISSYLGIPPQSVLPSNGSTELFYIIPPAFKYDASIIITPTFSEYEKTLNIHHITPSYLETKHTDNFTLNIYELYTKIKSGHIIYICNPNNPTGTSIPKETLLEISEICHKKDALLVIDEAFIEFTKENALLSMIHEGHLSDHIIIIRSLTKIFAIAGLRIGYCISSPKNIKRLKRFQPPWSINCFAEAAAKACIVNKEKIIPYTINMINKERDYLTAMLSSIAHIKCHPSKANFILCSISYPFSSPYIYSLLLKKGILIRDCSNVRGLNSRFFRLAIRRHKENERLLKELMEIIDGC